MGEEKIIMTEDNILIVDDEENVISALKRVFMEDPITIFSATCASDGLELLKRHTIKVVISDERMPGTSGSEFLTVICRDYPDIIRIMLTGHASFDAAMRAINEGEIYRFFMKPWNDHDLRMSVRAAIDKFNLERELLEKKELIKHMAYHDALTGLPNRLLLNDRITKAIEYSQRHRQMLAICFLDLDGFKAVNDNFGHDTGDLLLKQVSERLSSCVRKSDTVARLGGDEFVVMLQDVMEPGASTITSQKILKELAMSFYLSGQELFITASIGISLYPTDGVDVETLMKKADIAMYNAKEAGKNIFLHYKPDKNMEVPDARI